WRPASAGARPRRPTAAHRHQAGPRDLQEAASSRPLLTASPCRAVVSHPRPPYHGFFAGSIPSSDRDAEARWRGSECQREHSLTLPTAPVTLGALTIRTLGARPRSEWRRHALFEGELTLMKSRPSRRVSRRSFVRSAGLLAGGAWLAGCAPTTGGTAAPKPAAPAAGATSAPAAAARPAGGGPPLKIGVLLPYSGVYTTLGESITNAMQLYFDSVGNTA